MNHEVSILESMFNYVDCNWSSPEIWLNSISIYVAEYHDYQETIWNFGTIKKYYSNLRKQLRPDLSYLKGKQFLFIWGGNNKRSDKEIKLG